MVAPLALIQLALPRLSPGAAIVQRHLRRGASRPTRAGAATAPRRRRSTSSPAILAAEQPRPARLRRRPRRHAHADAPGGVPRRGHLGPPAARGERPGPARADRGRGAERPLPRARGRGVAHERARAAIVERARPPEPRGRDRDDVALLVARPRATARVEPPRFGELGDLLRRGRPARREHLGHAAGRAAGAPRRRARSRCTSRRRSPAGAGSSSCARPTLEPLAPPPLAARVALPAGAAAELRGAVRRGAALVDRAARAPVAARRATSRATAARSATRTAPATCRSTPTRPSSRASPAAPRCRAPARPFTAELVTRARGARRPVRAAHAARGRVLARAAASSPTPSATACRPSRRGSSTPRAVRGGRVIAVGTTVVRALETVARRRRRRRGGDGLHRPRGHARARAARGRRTAHRLARAASPRTCRLLEAAAGAELLERSYARARASTATLARVRRRPPDPALSAVTAEVAVSSHLHSQERRRHEGPRSRRHRCHRKSTSPAARGRRARRARHDSQRREAGRRAASGREAGRGGRARRRSGRARRRGIRARRDRARAHRPRRPRPAPLRPRVRAHQPTAHRGHRPPARGRARGRCEALRRTELRGLAVRGATARSRPKTIHSIRSRSSDARGARRDPVPGGDRGGRRLDRGHRPSLRRLLRSRDVDLEPAASTWR